MKQNINSALLSLGLSEHEIIIYKALLKSGATTTGPLISATKLHRQFVYNALDRLLEKSLVSFATRSNRKVFTAAHPSLLLQLQEERLKSVKDLIPELLALQGVGDELQIRVLRGREEFFRNLITVIDAAARTDKRIRVIGGAADVLFYNTLGKRYDDYTRSCKKAGVKKYLVAPKASGQLYLKKFLNDKSNHLKLVESGLSSPSYTRITKELVTIEVYAGTAEVVIIQMWSRAVAQGYLEHFKLLWGKD